MKLYLCLLFFFIGCLGSSQKKVLIIKQWHLSPDQVTTDIKGSTSLPQYQNQYAIYKMVESLFLDGKTNLVIAEGCEGEIDDNFTSVYNGWSIKSLKDSLRTNKDYDYIMAPVGMKLKAKYPSLRVLCGDDDELISENLKAMSDLRGFSGFYTRLVESQLDNLPKFQAYAKQLKSLYPNEKIEKPISFTLERSLKALKTFQRIISERNRYFSKVAKENYDKNPIIIIGGLHVGNLKERIEKKSLKVKVITPTGYIDNETLLVTMLEKNLMAGAKSLIHLFQVPAHFDINKFPFTHLIDEQKIATPSELSHLKSVVEKKLPIELIFSDFDKDGIRDFTLSQNGEQIIISAEDSDWDGDGIDNIQDYTVGEHIVAAEEKTTINNHYFSQSSPDKVKEETENKLVLISKKGVHHELLVLEVMNEVLKKLNKQQFKIKYAVATKPSFSYGESVFFSYISQSKALEYYPEKLSAYLNKQYQEKFKGVKYDHFVNSYIVPLLIHSISHELAHSLEYDNEESLGKEYGWDWKWTDYQGQYLKTHRMKEKIIHRIKTHITFRGKAYKEWMELNKKYAMEVNSILKIKDQKKKKKLISNSSFLMKNASSSDEHKLSFLNKLNLVSLYSLNQPREWFAENYALCAYRIFFPNSIKALRSIELEHLLGINPKGVPLKFCKLFHLD